MDCQDHLLSSLFPTAKLPLLMGILNATPDSFSDGNRYPDLQSAVKRAKQMIELGADIIDVGGESTRPGAAPLDLDIELNRVIPLLEAIRNYSQVVISVDTRKAHVAAAAIAAGANLVNDVSALQYDPEMVDVLAENPNIGIIMMHIQGTPENMQLHPYYNDVITDIKQYFHDRIAFCQDKGIELSRIMLDPGIGFGKDAEHNLTILARMRELQIGRLPLVLGASRKRFIDAIHPSGVHERLGGSLAATAAALEQGVAVIRVHDVLEHKQFIQVIQAIRQKGTK